MLLNPSCSELVTYLGITDIEEKFGYKVRFSIIDYMDFNNKLSMNVDFNELNISSEGNLLTYKGLVVDEDIEFLEENRIISRAFLKEHQNDYNTLKEMVKEALKLEDFNNKHLSLVLADSDNNEVSLTAIASHDDQKLKGLSMHASQHCSCEEFPILGNVYLMNTDKYQYLAFDGGDVEDFELWLNLKQVGREAEIDQELEKLYEQKQAEGGKPFSFFDFLKKF